MSTCLRDDIDVNQPERMTSNIDPKSVSEQEDVDDGEKTLPKRKNRGRQKVHANIKSPQKPAPKNYHESDDEEEDDDDVSVTVKKSPAKTKKPVKNTPKKKSEGWSEEEDEEEEPRRKPRTTKSNKGGAKWKKSESEYSEDDEEEVEKKSKRRGRRQQSDNEHSSSRPSDMKVSIRAGRNVRTGDIACTNNYITGTSTEPTGYMKLVVESWKKDDKLCYETKGVKAVREKICSHSNVCAIGVPGSGKSTAIRHAALHLQKTSQYTIYPLDTPEDFKKYLDTDKEQVFVFDDTVGEYSVDKKLLHLWDRLNADIKRCLEVSKNTKLLTSLRLQLYSDEKVKGKSYIFNSTDKKVNFSDKDFKLSSDDMKNMLRHYLEVRNVGNIEALIRRICWLGAAKSADCFPLLCKVFSDNESVRENPDKFFTAPFLALTDIFTQIKSRNKHQFCGLLLCAFMELEDDYLSPHYTDDKPKIFTSLIESQNLDPKKDLADIKNELRSLDGVYISHVEKKYDFLHSTFRDLTTFLYKDKYVIFQHATRDLIKSRVRLFTKLSEDDDYVLVFEEDCIELLVNRMIRELKCQTEEEGVGFIVENHYIDDERVVNGLCTKLFDSQDTAITHGMVDWCMWAVQGCCVPHGDNSQNTDTQDMVDELFRRCMEAMLGYNLDHRDNRDDMSWPCYKMLVRLIPRVDCTRQTDLIIECRNYPVFWCVATGSVSLTKLAVQQNSAMINAVDSESDSVLHFALRCVNNVDMTRYLLSLPNLTRLNHRNEYGRTPYWYVLYYWNSLDCNDSLANRQEMMDIYKQAGAIARDDSSDDNVPVFHGDDCIELLVNIMIHELKCPTEEKKGISFIVGNRYIDDERVVNGLCTKLFDSQDTGITQDMVNELFCSCMEVVLVYSREHIDNRDEMSWPCYKLLVGLIPRVDCTREREIILREYPVFVCVATGIVSLTKLVVQQNNAVINTVDVRNDSVLHRALECENSVDMTRYLLSLPNLTCLNHRNKYERTPYWYVVHGRHMANRQEMMDIYKQKGAIALGSSSDDDDMDVDGDGSSHDD